MLQKGSKTRDRRTGVALGNDIGYDFCVSCLGVLGDHYDMFQLGMTCENCFDFGDINSETSNFYLKVLAAKELEAAVLGKASEIAAKIEIVRLTVRLRTNLWLVTSGFRQ